MAKLDQPSGERTSQGDLRELLSYAQDHLPGVLEMLQVYGGYEQALAAMAAYLEPTRPQPIITTSNQTVPIS